ncbi:hypothetical protein, partial [Klebsiella variicola]|uniref:hypothetical protein n=1 Tax=Klebsiella variicola TaxID=244366 RepID=UPI00272F5F65
VKGRDTGYLSLEFVGGTAVARFGFSKLGCNRLSPGLLGLEFGNCFFCRLSGGFSHVLLFLGVLALHHCNGCGTVGTTKRQA